RFRMDVWNSFAPHLLHLLQVGARELAAETL
ncbi:sarcosine oxidase subunit gamma, partial [Salipiger pacificus]|nr:sarcosine oxidase subunit gamma [Salipiger mangrovisoli]